MSRRPAWDAKARYAAGMADERRFRPLVLLLFALVLLVLGGGGVWWTWPSDRTPSPTTERVGVERRPQWTRAPRLPRVPTLGVELPPASRVQTEPVEDTGAVDTGSPAFGPARITGWLVDSRGRDVGEGVVLASCTLMGPDGEPVGEAGRTGGRTDSGGFFDLSVTGPAECRVEGRRQDGLLRAFSEPITLWVEPGEELEVDVIVPHTRTGGIGISFRESDEGIRVVQVHEDTPAWRAGLRRGDLIVAVDGDDTLELDQDTFVRRMTGPEGSEVRFTVQYDEDGETYQETHVVERQFLDEALIR